MFVCGTHNKVVARWQDASKLTKRTATNELKSKKVANLRCEEARIEFIKVGEAVVQTLHLFSVEASLLHNGIAKSVITLF